MTLRISRRVKERTSSKGWKNLSARYGKITTDVQLPRLEAIDSNRTFDSAARCAVFLCIRNGERGQEIAANLADEFNNNLKVLAAIGDRYSIDPNGYVVNPFYVKLKKLFMK